MVPGSPAAPMRVNGERLEAWMLKTMVGGVFCGAFPLPDCIAQRGIPPPFGFLRVLFRQDRLPEPLGLYLRHGTEGEKFLIDHHVLRMQVVPGSPAHGGAETVLCGLKLCVFGIEFYLSVLPPPDPPPERLQQMVYRPTEITGPAGESLVVEWEGIGGGRPVQFGDAS